MTLRAKRKISGTVRNIDPTSFRRLGLEAEDTYPKLDIEEVMDSTLQL